LSHVLHTRGNAREFAVSASALTESKSMPVIA
jgi:hypothetical protein